MESRFERIFHTLSTGAVISRVTLIVLAKTFGRVTKANVIAMNIIAIICGCSLIRLNIYPCIFVSSTLKIGTKNFITVQYFTSRQNKIIA
jgi:hypothetical protein